MSYGSKILISPAGGSHGRGIAADVRAILGCTEEECPDALVLEDIRIERIERMLCAWDAAWLAAYLAAADEAAFYAAWQAVPISLTQENYIWLYLAGAHKLACELFNRVYRPELKTEQSLDYRYERFPNGMQTARDEICGGYYHYLGRLGKEYLNTCLEIWQGSDDTTDSGSGLHTRQDGM
jgi:hypothetical protein